ncbi:hypothetical protein SAMN05216215_107325 [Saccharopolyspora shandongensis]|uniref:Uncharacterized protein n=1 Tax=Saccharopolyspora shandongensis TaxID=418495 RepID=A0A1H3T009_9PSEU|nr:hypothetical protein SAMN05216215_107325 [Saccharopolyspora shandongensis]
MPQKSEMPMRSWVSIAAAKPLAAYPPLDPPASPSHSIRFRAHMVRIDVRDDDERPFSPVGRHFSDPPISAVRQSPRRTSIFPVLAPFKTPINASGARSIPRSTVDSACRHPSASRPAALPMYSPNRSK